MPFSLASICTEENWKKRPEIEKVNSFSSNNTEPTSVLLMRRSPTPSPPTSASTLSSSANGGASAKDAVSAATEKKEEWANELHPILVGTDRCGGLGLEDWETMWSDPGAAAAAAAVPEQSLFRWIAGGDMDEASLFGLKQLLQTGNHCNNSSSATHLDFEGNAVGFGIVDQGAVLDPMGNLISSSGLGFASSGFNANIKMDPNYERVATNGGDSSVLVVDSGSNTCNVEGSIFNNLGVPVTSPPHQICHSQTQQNKFVEEKPQIVGNQQLLMNQSPQNPNFFMPLPYNHQETHVLQPPLKRHNSSGSDTHMSVVDINIGFGTNSPNVQFVSQQQHFQQQPLMVAKHKLLLGHGEEEAVQRQQQTILDQLYKAAELVGTGNFSHAQGILARLNHQLSPVGKPLHRAAYYFKDALQLLLFMNPNNNPAGANPLPRTLTPFDVIFKMGAYKIFSEISPLIQFVNFTSNQAMLEALDSADRIHIVDFDIGFGAQWASFIQELPLRSKGAPALRITAFASASTHHSIELALARENLTQFANEVGVSFKLEVVNSDYLEQQMVCNLPVFGQNENEAVAVNFPLWCSSNQSVGLHSLIRFIRQLSPRIMVCLDRDCERTDLPFPQHMLHALQSYINLLESLDAANVSSDVVNKIERFLLQPRIESTVLGRMRVSDKMPQWKTLLATAGFSPVNFSNISETQAECVVKRAQTRGYHVEKRHASLVLCWLRRELISASAWRC